MIAYDILVRLNQRNSLVKRMNLEWITNSWTSNKRRNSNLIVQRQIDFEGLEFSTRGPPKEFLNFKFEGFPYHHVINYSLWIHNCSVTIFYFILTSNIVGWGTVKVQSSNHLTQQVEEWIINIKNWKGREINCKRYIISWRGLIW